MPRSVTKNGFDARRFALLMAGFDTGNPSETEAMGKARALRRMVAAAGLRIVDVMGRADVKQALDDQMEPLREESRELQEAREEAAALRAELTERTRDVRELAELLTQERETSAAMQRELAAVRSRANQARPMPAPVSHCLVGGGFVAAVVVMVVALLAASVLCGESSKGRRADDELGKHKGEGAAVLRKSGSVLPFSNPDRLPRGVRRGGASGDIQSIRKFPESSTEQLAGPVR